MFVCLLARLFVWLFVCVTSEGNLIVSTEVCRCLTLPLHIPFFLFCFFFFPHAVISTSSALKAISMISGQRFLFVWNRRSGGLNVIKRGYGMVAWDNEPELPPWKWHLINFNPFQEVRKQTPFFWGGKKKEDTSACERTAWQQRRISSGYKYKQVCRLFFSRIGSRNVEGERKNRRHSSGTEMRCAYFNLQALPQVGQRVEC